jgi:hypothetical protein
VARPARTASFGRRPAGHVPAPQRQISDVLMNAGLSRALLLVRRPATSLRTKTKSVNQFLRPGDARGPPGAPGARQVLAGFGWRSLAAVAVLGCSGLFPACFVARGFLACVRLSSSVASARPVVAAVRVALARSQPCVWSRPSYGASSSPSSVQARRRRRQHGRAAARCCPVASADESFQRMRSPKASLVEAHRARPPPN